jgi:hypothetical protein
MLGPAWVTGPQQIRIFQSIEGLRGALKVGCESVERSRYKLRVSAQEGTDRSNETYEFSR